MNKDEIIEFIKNNLSLNVETSLEYTGNADQCYEKVSTLQLILLGQVICEATL